jgi:hypothetical protein
MRHLRNARLAPRLRGGADGPLSRRCPVCEAAPGWRCVRFVAGQRVGMKKIHAGR